jgi:DNA-binding PadR family transcriptional regulator
MVDQRKRQARQIYYALTRAGKKALEQEAWQWERLSSAISLIVRTAEK